MTNTTDTPETAGTAPTAETVTADRGLVPLPRSVARLLITVGAVRTIASSFLSWTWTSEFPGDLTVYGSPAGLQVIALVAGLLVLLYSLTLWNVRGLSWLNPPGATAPVFLITLSAFAVCWFTGIAIAVDLDGLVNLDPGAYIAMAASALPVVGALALPHPAPGIGTRAYVASPDQPPPGTLSALTER